MKLGFLIKNGTVVDGTGAPAYRADVRVTDDVISEIGPDLERRGREQVIDATGCYVAPGFMETHNHFDAPMWWLPSMEPMPGYGVTTSINGNCGFGAAPISADPAVKAEAVKIFSFFEDIPEKPFLERLPWDWQRWSEYRASLERNVKLPLNFAAYCGHIPLRLTVMGLEAWDRAATPDEIARMAELLDDALGAGAIGLSTNLLDNDGQDRPILTKKADDAEWSALLDVLERHPGKVLQVIVDYVMRVDAPQSMERVTRLVRGRNVRVQVTGAVPTLAFQDRLVSGALDMHEARKAEGLDVWAGYHHVASTILIGFINSLVWAQTNNYVWNEIIEERDEQKKLAMLADPEWRARARASWDSIRDVSRAKSPDAFELFDSETNAGPTGILLSQFMRERGYDHPSDALADWVIDNGVHSNLRMEEAAKHDAAMRYVFDDPKAIGNISDAGAHGKMFCGIGDNVLLLTRHVRDKNDLTIEQAVHILTGRIADFFNLLPERGTLHVGKKADITVFDLDEIERRPEFKRFDVPDGEGGVTYRYSRDPAPMRLTLVNGEATFVRGEFTGKFPGRIVTAEAPGRTAQLQAAE
ncbi:N-acyl-D-amino-acid deacylase family protein [Sphingomonas jatrophae]|uniref:N-acyl-D-aspartate/D-glutamate deacylase n=1 Tax=Sphingomonas jatrophae TaxID=1166337 RepID=A0A1I6KC38_9SPHN|nr:amidohydrolase family protein [Sphingomonas jatrophae]SFR88855.1 N-acyl-D-aspartate/D-glutamate deacylase [Sphingomonas jatrophae]